MTPSRSSHGAGDDHLRVVDLTFAEANAYVLEHHRHSEEDEGHKWSIGALAAGEIVGVAIIGRPKAHPLQDGWTLEVTRLCTEGYRNACSFLYGASWRLMKAHGYLRAVTYVKEDEDGASVRAAGWLRETDVRGREWDTPSRRRELRGDNPNRVRYGIRAAAWRPGLAPRPKIITTKVPREQMELAA